VAVPAGVVAATATFAAYLVARDVEGVTLEQARSVATLTLAGVGVVVLGLVARPLNRLRAMVLVAVVAAFVVVLAVPGCGGSSPSASRRAGPSPRSSRWSSPPAPAWPCCCGRSAVGADHGAQGS